MKTFDEVKCIELRKQGKLIKEIMILLDAGRTTVRNRLIKNNLNERSGGVENLCKNCNNSFRTVAANIKRGKGKFCSPECVKEHNIGENNYHFKGEKVGYFGVHAWVRVRKPKPELCEKCKIKPAIDLANISGEYKRDINDYEYLCQRCHRIKDAKPYSHVMIEGIESKKCNICKQTRPTSEFYFSKTENRFKYCCKKCENQNAK